MKEIKRARVHQIYKQKDGTRVPGCTTITKYLMNSQVLINWANRLGLEGFEVRNYVDELASIGTCLHSLIEHDLQNIKPDLGDFTGNQLAQAQQCFTKYEDWKKKHAIIPIALEKPLVSEAHPFGATGDFFGLFDGDLTYIDFKTAKACYPEHKVQAVALTKLWEENTGDLPKKAMILRVGREMDEGFEEIEVAEELKDPAWEAFTLLCRVHQLNKAINPYQKSFKRYKKK